MNNKIAYLNTQRNWDLDGFTPITDLMDRFILNNKDEDKGEWYIDDNENLTLYYGVYNKDHPPGSPFMSFAIKFDDKQRYIELRNWWEMQPEYADASFEDEYNEWSDSLEYGELVPD